MQNPDKAAVTFQSDAHEDLSGRRMRRLGEKVLRAFDQACEHRDIDAAWRLLTLYEAIATRQPITLRSGRRQELNALIQAHRMLWTLIGTGLTRQRADT
jgi:RecA-family ATPase